ncbi:AbrB family transcriptional regulator [Archaeoglobales archaeon]|nr:MAG: AbrB family transcriptional regulator [Archaeoglobales archaeon]
MKAKVDKKGRLYIPKQMRNKIGEEVYLVETKDGLMLIPKPEDPLKMLEEIGKALPDKSIDEIKKDILEQAKEELR